MTTYVFASYGMDVYLVSAETPTEAKGKMWDQWEDGQHKSRPEFLGDIEQVMGEDGDVVEVQAP